MNIKVKVLVVLFGTQVVQINILLSARIGCNVTPLKQAGDKAEYHTDDNAESSRK